MKSLVPTAVLLLLLITVAGCAYDLPPGPSSHKPGRQIHSTVVLNPEDTVGLETDYGWKHWPVLDRPRPIDPRPRAVVKPPVSSTMKPLLISKAGWNPAGTRKWSYIVIHHSATDSGNAARFDRYHRETNGWKNGLGYNFVIGNGRGSADGEVEVGPRWRRQIDGAHAGSAKYNKLSIGVCLVGNFVKGPPSDRQLRALVELINFLQKKYQISDARILLHKEARDARRGPTVCPGPYFDKTKLVKMLQDRRRMD